jgi:hypothetical protein
MPPVRLLRKGSTLKPQSCRLLLALLGAALSQSVHSFPCTGKPTYLGVDSSGDVIVGLSSTPVHRICNLSLKGNFWFSVEACRSAYATLLTARVLDKNVNLHYNDSLGSCAALPNWGYAYQTWFVEAPY